MLDALCFDPVHQEYLQTVVRNPTFKDRFESTYTEYRHFKTQAQVNDYKDEKTRLGIFSSLMGLIGSFAPGAGKIISRVVGGGTDVWTKLTMPDVSVGDKIIKRSTHRYHDSPFNSYAEIVEDEWLYSGGAQTCKHRFHQTKFVSGWDGERYLNYMKKLSQLPNTESHR